MDHIDAMDELRQGIGLRAYGQRDPVMEYKLEGFEMFDAMIADHPGGDRAPCSSPSSCAERRRRSSARRWPAVTGEGSTAERHRSKRQPVRKGKKIGRNDPCPCGSGKKYKHCCLGKDQAQS